MLPVVDDLTEQHRSTLDLDPTFKAAHFYRLGSRG